MKFDKFIQHKMRKIFLEKSHAKYGGENIPRPFSKELKFSKA